MAEPTRRALPATRAGVTHQFQVGELRGHITVNRYPNGDIAEFFVDVDRPGSTIRGLVDAVAISVSVGLQHGIPLEVYAEKFVATRFGPAGPTDNPAIRQAGSVLDYIFRYLLAIDQRQGTLFPLPSPGPAVPREDD